MKKLFLLIILIIFLGELSVSASDKNNIASKNINSNIHIFFVNPVNKSKPARSGDGEAIKALLKLINNAQESIDFAIYGISNEDEIFQALINAQNK